ncbi:MAG TPA: aminotransferase class V-fold PLP-dependent enzyme [Verrucomicrobiae bacterium]|nr:aminotransferase class V-fold PLP-dependent enzyme [Verrucomicrobiae bacterium]
MSIYLDNAATSHPKPDSVYAAVDYALRTIGVAPGRGSHRRGIEAARLVFQAREALASLLGIPDSSRVVFTHSATEALNLAISGILRPGDHAVTSSMEHNSVARPLHRASLSGVQVEKVPCDVEGFLDPRDLERALRPQTRLVVISHCSNVTGSIQPVEEIARITRSRGIPLLLDAAQSAGVIPIDVAAWGVDLLAAPGHKGLLGPQGTGFLYIGESVDPAPLLVGGTGASSSDLEQPADAPERFESGTMNTPGIAGLKAGAEFVLARGVEEVRRHEAALVGMLLEGLREIPGVTMHGPKERPRGGVVSFTLEGIDPSEVGFRLDREFDITVRVGLHCAPDAHRTIGTFPAGTVRVSPGIFNTAADMEQFIAALRAIAER